jgi:hypothetical protein
MAQMSTVCGFAVSEIRGDCGFQAGREGGSLPFSGTSRGGLLM